MTPQRKKNAHSSSSPATTSVASFKKARRSIKAEGNCLTTMLREGVAKVIDASKLGKRLSSDIWTSFGAIQVSSEFAYPSIETKIVIDGTSTLKVCNFFVACSRCFSVFKYDGHAYGTTGLVKHVKICKNSTKKTTPTRDNSSTNAHNNQNDISLTGHHDLSTSNGQAFSITDESSLTYQFNQNSNNISNDNNTVAIIERQQVRKPTPKRRPNANNNNKSKPLATAAIKNLTKLVEQMRNEQEVMKQKIHDLINVVTNATAWPVSQYQFISNEADEDEVNVKVGSLQSSSDTSMPSLAVDRVASSMTNANIQ